MWNPVFRSQPTSYLTRSSICEIYHSLLGNVIWLPGKHIPGFLYTLLAPSSHALLFASSNSSWPLGISTPELSSQTSSLISLQVLIWHHGIKYSLHAVCCLPNFCCQHQCVTWAWQPNIQLPPPSKNGIFNIYFKLNMSSINYRFFLPCPKHTSSLNSVAQ